MRFRVNTRQVISETIDGETIMIGLTTGNYYSLDETGSHVWSGIERVTPVDDIVTHLTAQYDGQRAEIEAAVLRLLDELRREDLITPYDGEEQPSRLAPETNGGTPRRPFRAPRFEKHTDMQDLILLDPVHEVGETGWPHTGANTAA